MKKLIVLIAVLFYFSSYGQNRNPVKYSKLFDSYYRKGPLKFTFEPGLSIQSGLSYSVGFSANYKFNAPIEGVLGLRAVGLASGNLMQLNVLGRYYLRYDRVRTNYDRRQKPKFWKLYAVTGLSLAPLSLQVDVPLGLGIPLRLSDRVALIPEFSYYYSLGGTNYMLATIGIEFNPKGERKNQNMRKRGKAVEQGEGESSEDADTSETPENTDKPENADTIAPEPVKNETPKEEVIEEEESEDDGE